MPKTEKVIVGLSGGVDSSVSALLLQQQGYDVEGLFMKNWEEDDGTDYCTAKEDLADAQKIANILGIKLHTANFATEYWDNVFEHFLAEYKAGRTPNPDVLCNKEIKFKVFIEYAELLGGDYIATGHYVRKGKVRKETRVGTAHVGTAPEVEDNIGGNELEVAQLLKGLDNNKDQSYFLHAVPGEQIAKSLFPVGELEKPVVRAIAAKHGFINHDKKDSTGICFIGERRFKDFLARYIPAQPGEMITENGTVIGTHQGLMFYTLGQRQGLGIGGVADTPDSPWYVIKKDLNKNQLVVTQGNDNPLLFSRYLITKDSDWIDGQGPEFPYLCMAKTRYRQSDQHCKLVRIDNTIKVTFDELQRSVTPGQYVVFYDGDICIGGGVIESTGQ